MKCFVGEHLIHALCADSAVNVGACKEACPDGRSQDSEDDLNGNNKRCLYREMLLDAFPAHQRPSGKCPDREIFAIKPVQCFTRHTDFPQLLMLS